MAEGVLPSARQIATQARIDEQIRIVASYLPDSVEHRLATRILLLLQDSLLIHQQIDELLAEAKRRRGGAEE